MKLFKVKYSKPQRNMMKTNFAHFYKRTDRSDHQDIVQKENEIYDRINPRDSTLINCSEI